MGETTVEEVCSWLRAEIEKLKQTVADTMTEASDFQCEDSLLDGANIPASKQANMKANLTLVFRDLENARMRCGKAMQAAQGGVSILDK